MPVVESSVVVPVSPDLAFAVSQTTGEIRIAPPIVVSVEDLDLAVDQLAEVLAELRG